MASFAQTSDSARLSAPDGGHRLPSSEGQRLMLKGPLPGPSTPPVPHGDRCEPRHQPLPGGEAASDGARRRLRERAHPRADWPAQRPGDQSRGAVIGISLGDMVHRVVAQLPERIVAKAKVVQPIGGSGGRLRVPAAKPPGSCSRSATMSPGAPPYVPNCAPGRRATGVVLARHSALSRRRESAEYARPSPARHGSLEMK